MHLHEIQKDAIILADSYLHTEIRINLLKQQKALSNVSVMTLTTYLNTLSNKEEDSIIYEYYNVLSNLSLQVFKKVALSADFIDELQRFVKDIKRYQIDLETLPERDVYQSELKQIIKAVFFIPMQIDYQLHELKNKTDFHNVYILDQASDIFKENVYKEMIQKGATRIEVDSLQPKKEFYYVLNKREEIEALARYIIKNDIDVEKSKLTILDVEYEGFVEQIFKRYKIPYSFVSSSTKNRLLFKYIGMIKYYLHPSTETLFNVVKEEVFNHPYMNDFMEYITIFKKNLYDSFQHVQEAHISEDIINRIEYNKLITLEMHAREVQVMLIEKLEGLDSLKIQEALIKIDTIINEFHHFSSVEDVNVVRKVRTHIKTMIPYIDIVPMDIFLHVLEKIQVQTKSTTEGLVISHLHEPLGARDHHFIVGASSDHYPNFPSLSGIFSEQYVKEIKYPTIEQRYALYEHNLQMNLCSSEHLVVFYATSSLDGKEKEASLEIENFMGQEAVYYKLPYTYQTYELETRLHKDISKQLFYPENVFKGSITAYEMYSNCPFKYFIRHGLKIYEPNTYELNAATTGTLMHYILEQLVKTYGKLYAEQTSNIIEQLLSDKIEELQKLYPQLKEQLIIVKKRIVSNMEKNLVVLKEMEKSSSLIPSKSEECFQYEFDIDDTILQLHGYIDRINENNDFISIIDYKSSVRKLKEEEVFASLQLQLLTYLVVSAKQSGKRPIGAYYYSLGNKQQQAQYATYQKKANEIIEYTKEDYYEDFLKGKKLEGWTTSKDVEAMDSELRFIQGVGYKQDGNYTTKTNIYDIESLEKLCIYIYKNLIGNIKKGTMDIIPTSCDFCAYGSICHYKGRMYEREQILVDEDIYLVHKGKERDS